jgi:hypothetical protein
MTIVTSRTPWRRDGDVINSRDYVPKMYENKDYVFGSRTFSLFQLKVGEKTFSRVPAKQESIYYKRAKWLQSNYGLSLVKAKVLLGRTETEIRRIEELIHGIIDSLLLFDTDLFIEKGGRKLVRTIVRKCLTMGPYNVGLLVTYWKELTNYLYNRLAGFEPVSCKPGKGNPFACLLIWPKVLRILNHIDVDKYLLEAFAHLTSTRQLPTADRRAETKALRVFFESVEEPYPLDIEFLNQVSAVAERIGEKCTNLNERKIISKPHISMSCAGSYYATTLEGGRGKEIRESLISRLTVIPEEDELIETPFGKLSCPKGKERWRYWCRQVPYTHYEATPFGTAIQEEEFNKLHLYYQGFDEAIGSQILVTSYLDYLDWKLTGLAIPCRVLTVPEPGFKARIVTTGPYWLNILQQGLSHQLQCIMKGHPSVRSSFQKTDQAWQSLYLFNQQGYPKDYLCLSSDLKEATDHIPKEIAVRLFTGFLQGCGLRTNLGEIALDLLKMDRCFISREFVSEKQTRGIMMGEPLTKGLLSIMNLVVEEFAYRKYHNIELGKSFFKSDPLRTFHVGGDDHLAIGPKQYLDYITEIHLKCGNHLSVNKHGTSALAVKYCEKVLQISNIYSAWSLKAINNSTKDYECSPFVDSIKVRLLSPTTKSYDVAPDRNVAIGKGMSLGRTLKWLNKDHFDPKWVKMVRDRFFQRMGSLLPDRSSGVFWQLMLPSYWGGLDLYLPGETPELYSKLPALTLSIMEGYLQDGDTSHCGQKELSKFLTNYSFRGYRLNETEVEAMTTHIEQVIKVHLPSKKWGELKREVDPLGELSARELSDRIYQEGWHSESDIKDELLRPILFKEILLGTDKPSPYNTVRLKTRYAKLWNLVYQGEPQLSFENFETLLKTRPVDLFYKVGYPEEIHFISDRGYTYKSALDDALNGMPVLSTGFPFC